MIHFRAHSKPINYKDTPQKSSVYAGCSVFVDSTRDLSATGNAKISVFGTLRAQMRTARECIFWQLYLSLNGLATFALRV